GVFGVFGSLGLVLVLATTFTTLFSFVLAVIFRFSFATSRFMLAIIFVSTTVLSSLFLAWPLLLGFCFHHFQILASRSWSSRSPLLSMSFRLEGSPPFSPVLQ